MIFSFLLIFNTAPANAFEHGKEAYDNSEYPEAITVFDEVLSRASTDDATRANAWFFKGASHLALKQFEVTRRCFFMLLALSPDFQSPPLTSPKVRDALAEARYSRPSAHLQKTERGPPRQAAITLEVLNSSDTVTTLHWRVMGTGAFAAQPVPGRGEVKASIDSESLVLAAGIQFYVELRNGAETWGRLGSAEQPLEFRFPAAAPRVEASPIYKKWWLWTAISAVALGGAGTAAYFLLRPTTTVGTIDVHPQAGR